MKKIMFTNLMASHLILIVVGVVSTSTAIAAGENQNAKRENVIRYSSNMPSGSILARPDTDIVILPSGKRMKVGDIRKLTQQAKRMRTAVPGSKLSAALKTKPAESGGRKVSNAQELAKALQRPDSETVVLPSGRRATVGQIKFVQKFVEQKTGRSMTRVAKQRNLTGPAIKINKSTDWKKILQQPDKTILEAPDGKRITVGELKQALAASASTTPIKY